MVGLATSIFEADNPDYLKICKKFKMFQHRLGLLLYINVKLLFSKQIKMAQFS